MEEDLLNNALNMAMAAMNEAVELEDRAEDWKRRYGTLRVIAVAVGCAVFAVGLAIGVVVGRLTP